MNTQIPTVFNSSDTEVNSVSRVDFIHCETWNEYELTHAALKLGRIPFTVSFMPEDSPVYATVFVGQQVSPEELFNLLKQVL